MPDAAGYGPDYPGEIITVTAPDPANEQDPTTANELALGLPQAFPDFTLGDPGSIDLTTQPGTNPFGAEGEASRREKIQKTAKKIAMFLASKGTSLAQIVQILSEMVGTQDFGYTGLEGLLGDASTAQGVAGALGVPTLPTPNPGAQQSVSFLDWQPNNPMSNPESRMVERQVYRPDQVPIPPGLMEALLTQLTQEIGSGPAPSPAAGIQPRTGLGDGSYRLIPRVRLGGGTGGPNTAFY